MAGIIETLYVMIKGDSSHLKKESKEAKDSTDKLNASMSDSDKFAKKLNESFSELATKFTEAVIAFVSAEALIEGLKKTEEYSESLFNLAQELDTSAESLDEWGHAVQKTGGTIQGFQNTIQGLNKSLNEMQLRGSSAISVPLMLLGINARNAHGDVKSVSELLPEIAASFKRINDTKRTRELGEEIGLDPSLILLLQKGREETEKYIELQKRLGATSEKDTQIAHNFSDSLLDTETIFHGLFNVINDSTLPILTKLLDGFKEFFLFMKDNSDFAKGTITAFTFLIGARLIPVLFSAAVAAWSLVAPFALLGIGITATAIAVGLLYDDIEHFNQGQQSVIGDLIKKYPELGEFLKLTGKLIKAIWGEIKDDAGIAFHAWVKLIELIVKSAHATEFAISKIESAYKKAKSFLGIKSDDKSVDVVSLLQKSNNIITQAANTPIGLQLPGSLNPVAQAANKESTININAINIQTQATDAQSISQDIGVHLTNQMRHAINTFTDGVIA